MDFSNDEIKIIDTIPIMNKEEQQKKIVKCLKSYLTGKKYAETDDEKSMLYFKQCIALLNDIKINYQLEDNILTVIDETETECSKLLTKAIEHNIETPIVINKIDHLDSSDNELFNIVDTGDLSKLKKFKFGQLNFNIYNEEGLTPLHYAIKVGDTTFIKNSLKLGANIDLTNTLGHTLLEYACLEKDPNMITFLSDCGADMKKHLLFRNGKQFNNKGSQIDILLLEKYIMISNNINNHKIIYLNWIFKYIDKNQHIDLEYNEYNGSGSGSNNKIKIYDLIQKLDCLISKFNKETLNTYLSIIKEELEYDLNIKFGCPNNKLDIILYNLVPFLSEFNFNLRLDWLLRLEIKFLIKMTLCSVKDKAKINISFLKNELIKDVNERYIITEIIPKTMSHIFISQWLSKIKV
jgi:ankyrin repeat protein